MAGSNQDERRIPQEKLRDFGASLLHASGMAADEADTLAMLLVETSLRGVDSHGVVRFPIYSARCRAGGIVSPAPSEWIRDGGATSLLDAGSGAGHIVALQATERVIERAAEYGIATVGVRRSNHLGALALYAERIAAAGHFGIVMTNASPQIAPTGGAEGLLGNNPLAMGVPRSDGPIVMDMANSVAARGKIRLHKAAGTPIPEGWARNIDGDPTTDPDEALDGLLEPIAGHKGYALVFMIDVLCGMLTGARSGPEVGELTPYDKPTHPGHLFIAIDVERFGDRGGFENQLSTLVQRIHEVKRAPGSDQVFIPGEIESRTADQRRLHGIPASDAMLQDYKQAADAYGLACPEWLLDELAAST